MKDRFFGAKVSASLKYLKPSEKQKFTEEANLVYKKTVDYIMKYYNYEATPYQYFVHLNFKKHRDSITYENIIHIKNAAKVTSIDEDKLYDEIIILNDVLQKMEDSDLTSKNIDETWCKIFQNGDLPELQKIVEKVLSIPISNAYTERVFSLMSNLWTDERNRMRVDLVKAELCVKLNFNMACSQFTEFLGKEEQKSLF